MDTLKFEEYRQPWETGPHWELKREFLEKYQNDFPEDRLLCLAQAYSNIELMHCSYPDPVMLQIHELSKSLQGCKRFREAKKNFPKDEPELQARPGKRNALDDLKKPFKFIKFQSVGLQSSQKPDNLTNKDNFPEETSKTDSDLESSTNVGIHTSTTLPIASAANDPSSMEVTSNLELSALDDINKPFFSEEFGCKVNTFNILLIAQSPHFELIKDIALTIPKLQGKKKNRRYDQEIQNAAIYLKAEHEICFKNLGNPSMKRCICEFYIGDTLISVGRDNKDHVARKCAASSASEIFGKLSNLPIKTLNDLKNTTDEEELNFIKKFAEEITKDTQSELTASAKLLSVCNASNWCNHVTFFVVREDMRSPLHCRKFFCDLVIKKVLICDAKATNKKSAKDKAAEKGFEVLAKYFNIHVDKTSKEITSTVPLKSKEEISTPKSNIASAKKSNSQTQKGNIENVNQSSTKLSDTLPMKNEKSPVTSDPIIINYRLLNNSLQQQLAVLDNTAIAPISQQTPQSLLNYSMQFCKKSFSYEMSEPISTPEGFHYRCDIMLEGQCIGLGVGASKSEAKSNGSIKALQNLQNQFYTIKIKNEADDGFFIHRSQILNAEAPTNVVSDSNIGCKMLKMMGWSGGSLGNSGGITEPISASEHRFHQGLGYSKGNEDYSKFRPKIEALLREFSHTETTSDLIFGLDFTKDERKQLHKIATMFGLVSNSRGKGQNRQLFVRHKLTIIDLLNQLAKAGGRTSKYEFVDKSS